MPFTEEQIIGFLKEGDSGVSVQELCRKYGFTDSAYYQWKSQFGGMSVSEVNRLKALEDDNSRLTKLLAEAILDKEALKAELSKK